MSTVGRQSGNKLNQMVLEWPHGIVFTSEWMKQHGFSRQLVDKYKKNRWLETVGWGAHRLANDNVDWTGAVYALQKQLLLPIYPSGKTALQMRGLSHFVSPQIREIFLFGPHDQKLPAWYKSYDWGVKHHYFMTRLFPVDLGVSEFDLGPFSIKISSAERAVMELLFLVPRRQTLNESSLIMEHLVSLRPSLVQTLLENCNSIKVKRLFLFLAEKYGHLWFRRLDPKRIDLGAGKLSLTQGGTFNSKYQITIPKELNL